ncbi:MAG: flagellar basal body P-ring formation protein FlgA [Magnetococcales bacterium]|nr:flagellar basal body P-ring formation protein FlgA [Magnetococcales bacterium]
MNRFGQVIASAVVSALLTGWMPGQAHAQLIHARDVARASEQQLRAMLEGDAQGLRLEKVFYRDELRLPDGPVSWKVKSDVSDWGSGRQTIPVEVLVNGKPETVIQVAAIFKQSLRYPVLKRSLKRGEVVREGDIKWMEGDVKNPPAGMVESAKDILGMSATRSVTPDRPLQAEWFSSPQVVARGERVRVVAVSGALRIESTAVAKNPGRVGEIVSMENPDSHKRFDARITGPGHAEVIW